MENMSLEEITNLVSEQKFQEAKTELEKFAADDEKHIEALKLLGLCNINLEKYKEAQSNYETVVKYKPDDALSWFYLATCYDNLEDYLHAKSAYLEVIKLRDSYLEAYKCLAVLCVKTEEQELAVEYGKKHLNIVMMIIQFITLSVLHIWL